MLHAKKALSRIFKKKQGQGQVKAFVEKKNYDQVQVKERPFA
jgi:hypothetical protein